MSSTPPSEKPSGLRALSLGSGGSNGAYQAGAIQFLLDGMGVHYDIVCGTSVGALNGCVIAQFKKGEEHDASERLGRFWRAIHGNETVYRKWFGGWLWYLPVLWRRSVVDASPLHRMVRRYVDTNSLRASGKKFCAVAVSWGTGESRTWTERSGDVVQGILASSAYPIFFQSIPAAGMEWTDGGLRDITPLGQAIALGADKIDVIMCSPDSVAEDVPTSIGLLKQIGRFVEIATNEIQRGDLAKAEFYNRLVAAGIEKGKRQVSIKVLAPSEPLGSSLDFDPEKNARLMERGYLDAMRMDWGHP